MTSLKLMVFFVILSFSLTSCYLSANISGLDQSIENSLTPSPGSENKTTLVISGSIEDGIYNFSNTQSPLIYWDININEPMLFDHYEIAIGSSPGTTDILTWINVGTVTSNTLNSLNLTYDQTYYPSLRAIDVNNNSSNIISGDGWVALDTWLRNNITTHAFLNLNDGVTTAAEDSNNKIYLGGYFANTGFPAKRISKIDLSGNRVSTFKQGLGFDNRVYDSTLQNDGKILTVGWFNFYNGTPISYFARINTDGSLDTTLNQGTVLIMKLML